MSDPTQLNKERFALQEATGTWMPIATAPKDGTTVFLHTRRYGPLIGNWFDSSHCWRAFHHCGAALLNGAMDDPTHWMPKPECPSA